MTPDLIFLICNLLFLVPWSLLVFAPTWKGTQRLIHAIWIPALASLVYAWALFTGTSSSEGGGFTTLQGVMTLFTSPHAVLAGWVHYLIFDLFIGAWEVRDAQRRGIRHGFVVPCLVLTLMLGPLGLLTYLSLRFAITQATGLEEASG